MQPDGINTPRSWWNSDRINKALRDTQGKISHEELLARVAEAVRVELDSQSNPLGKDLRENYTACIIEGKILIGS